MMFITKRRITGEDNDMSGGTPNGIPERIATF